MRCLFCLASSEDSRSVEHIIPESLGNDDHVLPPGVVCDRCNNYFARKIERPLMQDPWFVNARFSLGIESKRKRIPPIHGIALPVPVHVSLFRDKADPMTSVCARYENDNDAFKRLLRQKRGSLVFLNPEPPQGRDMARFVGKVAIEALAKRVLNVAGGVAEITDHSGLKELRRFVRVGDAPSAWPMHVRTLYPMDAMFDGANVFHEWTLLYTNHQELFLVLALFGVEYALNLGGPEVDGYVAWLAEHDYASPLYPFGNDLLQHLCGG